MPGMSGTEFLTHVKERWPMAVTMILSAFSESEDIIDAVNKAGAFQYMLKPIDKNDFVQRVVQALKYYYAEEERKRLANANTHLLRKIAINESFFMMGSFSTALFDKFFPVLRGLMRDADERVRMHEEASEKRFNALMEQEKWMELCVVLSKLRLLSDAYHSAPNYKNESIASLLDSCVEEARDAIQRANFSCSVTTNYDDEMPCFMMHHETLGCAIKMIIENAILAAAAKGANAPANVDISADIFVSQRRFVRIDIRDSGAGVPLAIEDKIFMPLFSTRTVPPTALMEIVGLGEFNLDTYNHVGLGLSIARWGLSQHEGNLQLVNPGEPGALFRIEFPID